MRYPLLIAAVMLALGVPLAVADDGAIVVYKSLSPDVALAAAQAALKKCRDNGFQVAVAVVDRFGLPQVMLRDRFAGQLAADTATSKAYTALSFRSPTGDLARQVKSGQMDAGLSRLPRVAMLAGGIPIEAAGTLSAVSAYPAPPAATRTRNAPRAGSMPSAIE